MASTPYSVTSARPPDSGSVTAVMGRNGSGKSTLLWTLQGSSTASTAGRVAGRVRVAGVDPAGLTPVERRGLVGLVPQTAADLLYLETVADECRASDESAGQPGGATRGLLDSMVPGIPDASHPRDLSEGQRLALVLAIVLASRPRVLLLDEPTRGLDYPAKESLARIVEPIGCGRARRTGRHA